MCDNLNDDDEKLNRVLQNMWPESTDTIFLPLNLNRNHWILAVIDRRKKNIDLYDSIGSKNHQVIKLLCKKLDMVLNNKDRWHVNDHVKDIQQQTDSHSCALFTCWYAYQLATGGSVATWPAKIDWPSRVKLIAECMFISLVDRKLSEFKL